VEEHSEEWIAWQVHHNAGILRAKAPFDPAGCHAPRRFAQAQNPLTHSSELAIYPPFTCGRTAGLLAAFGEPLELVAAAKTCRPQKN